MAASNVDRAAARRGLAHDLNNYLTAKAGFAALLADGRGTPEEATDNRRMLARAQAELERMTWAALAAGTITAQEAESIVGDDLQAAVEAIRALPAT